jgi:heterodisulfide reductase subunit A-like polyferredoxin
MAMTASPPQPFPENRRAEAVPVRTETEILVCGGGLGGVAAAVAAARAGARTMLIERNSYPGGVATAGMGCSIFNCDHTRGGKLGIRAYRRK